MCLAQPLPTALLVKEKLQQHCGKVIRDINAKSSMPYTIPFKTLLPIHFNVNIQKFKNREDLGDCGRRRNNEIF